MLQWGRGGGGWHVRNPRISAWITHGYGQRDISRFINSLHADWKPPYAINGTCGGVRGGESPPYTIKQVKKIAGLREAYPAERIAIRRLSDS